MRILIISTFFPPLNSIASLRPYSWAKYWSRSGHDVTVLTTAKQKDDPLALAFPQENFHLLSVSEPPWISRFKTRSGSSSAVSKTSLLAKVTHWLRHRKGVLNAARMPDLTHFWIRPALKAVAQEQPWDLIVSTAGPYPVHLIANQLIKKGKGKKWIADYRDTWSDNYIYPGLFPFNKIETWLENRILQNATAIITVSPPFASGFQKRFPHAKVESIENGFDLDDLKALNPDPIFPDDGKIRIVHTGSIYLGKRNPSPLFQAIRQLSKEGVDLSSLEVIFVGPHNANLQQLIQQNKVEKWAKMGGFHSREDALRMQRDAHLLLFLPWSDPLVDGVLTGKVFEYLFSGTPIIAVGSSHKEASQKLIEEAKAGTALNDASSVKMFLKNYLRNSQKEKVSVNQTVLKKYSREMLAEKLLHLAEQGDT